MRLASSTELWEGIQVEVMSGFTVNGSRRAAAGRVPASSYVMFRIITASWEREAFLYFGKQIHETSRSSSAIRAMRDFGRQRHYNSHLILFHVQFSASSDAQAPRYMTVI